MTKPSDIISGFSLSLDQGIAQKLGIDAALIYNHIIYWLRINSVKPNSEKIEGKYWMHETQKTMAEFFGFYSEDQINKAIKKLTDSGLIIAKSLDKNPFNRTYSYTVYDQSLIKKSLRNPENDGIGNPKSAESDYPKSAESETLKSAECIYTTEEQQKKKQQQENKSSSSSSDSEKIKSMETLNLSNSTMQRALKFSLEEIMIAIQCCSNPSKSIDSIDAYFMSALTEKWQPKPNKEKIVKLQEEQEKQQQQTRQKLYLEAKQLEIAHKYNLKETASFSVNENSIVIKINGAFAPCELNDETLKILKQYIKDNHKNVF